SCPACESPHQRAIERHLGIGPQRRALASPDVFLVPELRLDKSLEVALRHERQVGRSADASDGGTTTLQLVSAILVTGAHGFVGGQVVAAARARGLDVRESAGDLREPEIAAA